MKRLLILLLSLAAVPTMAQQVTMREVFLEAPEPLIPILTQNNKVELLKAYDALQSGRLLDRPMSNRLGGSSRITNLTESFIQISLDEDTELQMKVVPMHDDSYLISMITTSQIEPEQSVLTFYRSDWEQIPTEQLFQMPKLSHFFSDPSMLALNKTKQLLSELGTLSYWMVWDAELPTLNIGITMLRSEANDKLYSNLREMLRPEGVTLFWEGSRFELPYRKDTNL